MNDKYTDFVLLITSAIHVDAKHTKLEDEGLRIKYTLEYAKKWIELKLIKKIVICDGTNFDLSKKFKCFELNDIEIEFLQFRNDADKVSKQGKGYGEGEIIDFAIKRSYLIKQSTHIIKCTSKTFVDNFNEILECYNKKMAFDCNGIFKIKSIDTRFYIIEKKEYIKNFSELYCNVNDDSGYYLEHCFLDKLKNNKISDYIMHKKPIVVGVSGSTGMSYEINGLKWKIHNFIRKLIIMFGV